jgi:hypothetical protein
VPIQENLIHVLLFGITLLKECRYNYTRVKVMIFHLRKTYPMALKIKKNDSKY